MLTFRIDNRGFTIGDKIKPQKKFYSTLDAHKKHVEDILEQNRPDDKPPRNSILMLFQEFEHAKKHWTKQKNSKFYNTDINKNDISHIGDYNKVEEIYKNLDTIKLANQIAKEYWEGQMTSNPIPEIFVKNASLHSILSNSEIERKNEFVISQGNQPLKGVRIITK